MTFEEKIESCLLYFKALGILLAGKYEVLESCNADISKYLIPVGTEAQVTYTSKPELSFRISDHWNWYANVNKCPNERYIQCLSVDLPRVKKREAPGKPSKPIFGVQVAVVMPDGKYHCVYGEKFDKKTKTWSWITSDPKDVAEKVLKGGLA